MDSFNSSKSYRVRDFLPSIRPSFLSFMLVFACGCLWLKNEAISDRLTALENRLNMFPLEGHLVSGSKENYERMIVKPTTESRELLLKKIQTHFTQKLDYTSVRNVSKESSTPLRSRNRRQVLNDTSTAITIYDVRKEITKQFEQLMPIKYCKSSEKVCPAGPPGLTGPIGAQGPRGRRGPRGKKGNPGSVGPPGRSGRAGSPGPKGRKGDTGMQGPPGRPGESGPMGNKGDTGKPGMTGPPGRPGESGPLGKKGDTGKPGMTGPPGRPGESGPMGEKGDTGKPGMTGPPGRPGESGPMGKKGDTGKPGMTGSPGRPGESGPLGKKGDTGKQGMLGPPGRPGESGPMGKKGETGKQGIPGPPGKSASAPNVVLSPAEQTRDEGGNTAFYCTVVGNPPPSVEWRFKGRKLLSGLKYVMKVGELTIKTLKYSDAGQYTCAATNILGSSEVSGILTVRGLPIFTKVPPSLATPMQYSTFRAVCQAIGFPPPMLKWTRLGMPLPVGRTEVNDGTLTIKGLSLTDNGFYDCLATNIMGTKKARINLGVQRKLASGLSVSAIIGNNQNHLTNMYIWLSPVEQSVNSNWKRCWRASVDGWASTTFHANCDGKGPTVTIIRVGGKYIFGGYTSLSWSSSSGHQYDSKAFLFSLVNKPGWAPAKLPQNGTDSHYRRNSMYGGSSYGPIFGGSNDIHITNQASSNRYSYTNLGYTYSPPSGHSFGSTFTRTFLAGSYYFTPDEVETFYETT